MFRAQRASSPAESRLIGDEIAALEERIIELGPETTFVRSPSESTFAQLASLEERAYYTRQQINQLPDARPEQGPASVRGGAAPRHAHGHQGRGGRQSHT